MLILAKVKNQKVKKGKEENTYINELEVSVNQSISATSHDQFFEWINKMVYGNQLDIESSTALFVQDLISSLSRMKRASFECSGISAFRVGELSFHGEVLELTVKNEQGLYLISLKVETKINKETIDLCNLIGFEGETGEEEYLEVRVH